MRKSQILKEFKRHSRKQNLLYVSKIVGPTKASHHRFVNILILNVSKIYKLSNGYKLILKTGRRLKYIFDPSVQFKDKLSAIASEDI